MNKRSHIEKIKSWSVLLVHWMIRLTFYFFLVLLFLVILLYLPPVQQIITGKVEKYISKKTHTTFQIDAIRLNFNGRLFLSNIYLEDMEKDTLLYAGRILIDVSIPKLFTKTIEISDLEVNDVQSNLFFDPENKFTNYDFLTKAFSSADKQKVPEDSGSDWKITFRNLHFEKIFLDLKIFEQMNLKADFGDISLKATSNDLNQLIFENDHIRVQNATIDLKMNGMNAPLSESSNTDEMKPLIASAGRFTLENIIFTLTYNDRIRLNVNVHEFSGKNNRLDLGQHKVYADQLNLSHSKMELELSDSVLSDQDSPGKQKISTWPFADFAWDISTGNIKLDQLFLSIHNRSIPDSSDIFTNQHLELSDLTFLAEDLGLNKDQIRTRITQFQFREKKGFLLNKLAANLFASPELVSIKDFKLETGHSTINAALETDTRFLTDPPAVDQESPFLLRIDESMISRKDLDFFIPANPMNKYHLESVGLHVLANGRPNKINLEDFYLQIGDSSHFAVNGLLKHILDPNRFSFNISMNEVSTTSKNLIRAFPGIDSINTYLPEELTATGNLKGTLKNVNAKVDIETSRGKLGMEANYMGDEMYPGDTIGLSFRIDQYDLRNFFDKDSLESITLTGKAGASGFKNKDIHAAVEMNVSSFGFADKVFHDLDLTGHYNPEHGSFHLTSYDPALGLKIIAEEHVEDSILNFNVTTEISGVDLKNLGISRNTLVLDTKIKATGRYNKDQIQGSLKIDSIHIKGKENLVINEILVDFLGGADSTYIDLHSDNISTYFSSNISPEAIPHKLKEFIIGTVRQTDSLEFHGNGRFSLDIQFKSPLDKFSEVFPDFKVVYIDHISIEFDETKEYLSAEIGMPVFNYKSIKLDTLNMNFLVNEDKLNYRADARELAINSLDISNLTLKGERKDASLINQFIKNDSLGTEQYFIEIDVSVSPQRDLFIRLNPNRLLLDGNNWEIMENSMIELDSNQKKQGKIQIERDNQQLLFLIENDSLYIVEARQFDVHFFSDFIGGDHFQLGGMLDAESRMIWQDSLSSIQAKLNVTGLLINGTQLGDLRTTLEASGLAEATLDLILENQESMIQVKGAYDPKRQNDPLRLNINMDIGSLGAFETIGNGLITSLEGKVKGNARMEGTLQDFKLNGDVSLDQVGFYSKQLNNRYQIENEKIILNNNRIQLKDFTIADSLNNDFMIDGYIDLLQKKDITFNLHILADQFTIYNASEKDNTTLYGQMILSADARATGSLSSPKLSLRLSVENGTNMTYVLPPKEINLVSYDDIVEFEVPDTFDSTSMVLEKSNLTDTIFSRFEGIDLQSDLVVNEQAQFKLVVDPGSGDFITVRGRGDLNVRYQQGSDAFLSGVYNLMAGEYRVSFYGLVQKSFNIQEGSTITWTGDPENARVNLTASHVLRTSSSGLVAAETVGLTDDEMRQYRRAIPYEIKIYITGTFKKPEFKFSIDLIDDDRAAYPLVISKLNRINSPGYESQLTEQVFGLLTIGSFIPEQTVDSGTGYGTALATTAAANSLNGILTGELNKLSGKYLQGVDIDIGMQTSSQMSSGNAATQTTMDVRFSKNFYNDRITIEAETSFDVGGDNYIDPTGYNYSNFQSDFAFKYDLTQKGDYKLKVFNKSSYDIIYKDIRTTGFAIIFVKDFDKVSDIKKDREKKGQQNNK